MNFSRSILTILIPLILIQWNGVSAQSPFSGLPTHKSEGGVLQPDREDFLITIAWPRALAKQTDAWYNDAARVLGINRRGYYRARLAALILVNAEDVI